MYIKWFRDYQSFLSKKLYELAKPLGWQCQINPSTWQWEIPYRWAFEYFEWENHQPNGDFPANHVCLPEGK